MYTEEQLTEAIELFSDPRYEVPTIVGDDQHIVPERVAVICRDVLTKLRDGELCQLPEDGLCCDVPAHRRVFMAGDGRMVTEEMEAEQEGRFDGD